MNHLDLDALADLLVGEGTEEQAEHIVGCARCADALLQLQTADALVRRQLADLPVPAAPADLAARVDAALAAERAAASPVPAGATERPDRQDLPEAPPHDSNAHPHDSNVLPLQRRDRRHGSPRSPWLLRSAAAAVAVLAIGGAVVAATATSGGDDTASTAAVVGAGAPEGAPLLAGTTVNNTGTDYARSDQLLPDAVPRLLQGSADAASVPEAPRVAGAPEAAMTGGLSRLRVPSELEGCLTALLEPTPTPLALDYAVFQDQPALVVVLASEQPDKLDVYVVGASCSARDAAVLTFRYVDKP